MKEIAHLYFIKKMSACAIARLFITSDNTIRSRIKRLNLPLRTLGEAQSIWQRGVLKTEAHKRKISITKMGKPAPKPIGFGKKISIALKGRKFSESHRKNISSNSGMRGVYGKNHPGWKGGNSTFARSLVQLSQYKKWRNKVYKKDQYTCQHCGQVGHKLNAHHKKKLLSILHEFNICDIEDAERCFQLWDVNNGITLCKSCHKKEERNGEKIQKNNKIERCYVPCAS